MKRRGQFLGVLALLCSGAALSAAPDIANIDLASERAAIEAFQARDQRLQDIGWKLVRGNAEFCAFSLPAIGLQLQDMASYGEPEIARRALGLSQNFAVQTAAGGSPADLAGAFKPNREITRIGSNDPNSRAADLRLDWRRLKGVHDHIDASLSDGAPLEFVFADGEALTIKPVEACATRFELSGGNARAVADGKRVVLGERFAGFAYDDELFAAAIAHELAHNLLGHRKWLDRNGRKRRNVRATEREADRLMPWLLANAGYDPNAAARFFEVYRPKDGSALFLPGSHDKWEKRARMVLDELPTISRLMGQAGKADWSAHFKRGIDPQKGR